MFQSAPALCRAGDLGDGAESQAALKFQSAPALCRAGDAQKCDCPRNTSPFQSAPALCRAGDWTLQMVARRGWRFNPRPLFSERATPDGTRQSARQHVSIRARSLQSGRLHFANLLMGSMKLASCREPWSVPVILHRRVRAWQPNTMRGKGCAYARTCRVCGGNRGSRIKPRVGHRNRWRGRCRIA